MTKSDYYQRYLRSKKWKAKRRQVLRRDGYQCTRCGNRRRLEVHHLNYRHLGNEPLQNLTTLCASCHALIHRRERIKQTGRKQKGSGL